MRRSIVSSDEIIHYTLEEKKKYKKPMQSNCYLRSCDCVSSHECNKSSVRCPVLESKRSAIRLRFVRRSLYSSKFFNFVQIERESKSKQLLSFYRYNIVKKKTFCFFFISNSKTSLKIIIKIDVDLIQGLISVLLNRCLHINIFR